MAVHRSENKHLDMLCQYAFLIILVIKYFYDHRIYITWMVFWEYGHPTHHLLKQAGFLEADNHLNLLKHQPDTSGMKC